MEKFPEDVITAEIRTGGDPNILDYPEFLPESRPDIASIFGANTPKAKRGRGTENINKLMCNIIY